MTAGTGQQNTRVVETNDHVAWLAWSLAALFVAMFVVGAALTLSSLSVGAATQPSTSSTWGTAGSLSGLVIFLPFLAFPLVEGPDRLQAPQEPYRLDLPGRRSHLDVHRRRSLHPRFRILPCDYRCATPVVLGTAPGAPWDLYDPAFPGWEASIEVVASVCVVLRGGDGSD